MASKRALRLFLSAWGLMVLCACTAARPVVGDGQWLAPGRYVQQVYRSPALSAASLEYTVAPLPVSFARGIGPAEAASLTQEELLQALQANGLRVNQDSPEAILSGQVEHFTVAAPLWRFLAGRGQARVRLRGEIRRGQEVLFAFLDDVTVNPAVNPRHQPAQEPNLLARQAARRLAMNLVNELLLPPQPTADRGDLPATQPAAAQVRE
ncbi:MAG: hypothetical protein ACUVRZ_01880 [Desulfobacca sp.]|uniref:hypothetical protein n=1 Tax=Desulfobacca sp. TaxID=2067990 RepID=UPI0040496E37